VSRIVSGATASVTSAEILQCWHIFMMFGWLFRPRLILTLPALSPWGKNFIGWCLKVVSECVDCLLTFNLSRPICSSLYSCNCRCCNSNRLPCSYIGIFLEQDRKAYSIIYISISGATNGNGPVCAGKSKTSVTVQNAALLLLRP
jgi:hypothetical protein